MSVEDDFGFGEHKLCKACGFCCDGTLFDTATIETDKHAVLTVEKNKDGSLFFHQPCIAHKNGECSIYSQRPDACIFYNCKLLKKLNSQNISEQDGMLWISLTRSMIAELDIEMANNHHDLRGITYYHRYINFKDYFKQELDEEAYLKKFGTLQIKFDRILEIIAQHFYEGKR